MLLSNSAQHGVRRLRPGTALRQGGGRGCPHHASLRRHYPYQVVRDSLTLTGTPAKDP